MAEKGIMVGRPSSEWLPPILEKLTAEERKVLDKWKGIKEMIIYGFPFDPQPIVKEPRWKVDEPFAIKVAPIGAYMMKSMNPNLEYSPEWIRDQMMGSLDAGACAIHVHVRNPDGSPTLDPVYYHKVIDPIKAKYGKNVLVDGCPEGGTTFEESMAPLIDFKGIAETAPITLAAIFWSNTAMCVTKDAVQSHVDFMQSVNQKPELVVHDCGSIDQARDWLIDSGVYKYRPVLWRICVGEPHLTTFHNPVAMLEVYNYLIRRIQDVEPNSVVEVSQCGRGALWQLTLAALYGPPVIGVRMGAEDSMWMYPHKDDKVADNPALVKQFVTILKALGRRPATASEFRKAIGEPLEIYDK
jgi:3-keto-5-aminohexanoate cleavage enzyme